MSPDWFDGHVHRQQAERMGRQLPLEDPFADMSLRIVDKLFRVFVFLIVAFFVAWAVIEKML